MPRFHAEHWDPTYWPRWMYGRIDHSLDTALRDWTELVDHALNDGLGDPELRADGLWAPYARPKVRWHPDRRPNAFADLRRDGQPVLAVTLGAYERIQQFAYRFFTIADLGEGIGDAQREGGTLAERARDKNWLRDPGNPICPIRLEACYLTAECCIPLLFYHEAGHVALGHFGNKRRARFRERVRLHAPRAGDERAALLDRARAMQLEELQADRFAIAIAANHWRESGRVFPKQRITIAALEPYLSRLLLIAVVAVHIAFTPDMSDMSDVAAYDYLEHPHPLTRLIDAIGSTTRAKILRDATDATVISDAFRLASLFGSKRLDHATFRVLAKAAEAQHAAILASADASAAANG